MAAVLGVRAAWMVALAKKAHQWPQAHEKQGDSAVEEVESGWFMEGQSWA